MRKLKLGAAVLLLGALVLFLLQNLRTAEVSFLVWDADIPIALPIICAFFIGGVAARPLVRFLNKQRRERSNEKAAEKTAAKTAAKEAAAIAAKQAAAEDAIKAS